MEQNEPNQTDGAGSVHPAPVAFELVSAHGGAPDDAAGATTAGRAAPPRRVLFFGKSKSRSRCTGALVDALRRNGLEVRWRNLSKLRRWVGRRLAHRLVRHEFERWKPDLVFVFYMDLPEVLLEAFQGHARIVQWVEEAFPVVPPRQLEYMRRADLVCLSDPVLLPQLRAQGIHTGCFQMSGFSPRYHFPAPRRRPVRDVAFIGGPGADRARAEFLLELADAHAVDVFGLGWDAYRDRHPALRIHGPVGNRGYRRVCAESRIVLGMNQFNSDPHYFSNRIWLTLACRGFHLTHYVPGIEDVFERGEQLDWFHDVGEAIELIDEYRRDDAERERIAEAGWRHAVARHQYQHRITDVLDLLARPSGGAARGPSRVIPGEAGLVTSADSGGALEPARPWASSE